MLGALLWEVRHSFHSVFVKPFVPVGADEAIERARKSRAVSGDCRICHRDQYAFIGTNPPTARPEDLHIPGPAFAGIVGEFEDSPRGRHGAQTTGKFAHRIVALICADCDQADGHHDARRMR